VTGDGIFPELRERYAAAAERAASEAPEIRPGDDIALNIQRLFADFPTRLAEHRASQQQEPGTAA
jgi:hypothetical protein